MSPSTQDPALVVVENNAQAALDDPVAFHNRYAFPLDVQYQNARRYADYLTKCANAKISIEAGRAPSSSWPTMPHEVGMSIDMAGYKWAEPSMDGPRTLDEVSPTFSSLQAPQDHTQSGSTTGPQSGMGNAPGTMVLGNLIPGTNVIAMGIGDTCVEGDTRKIPGPTGSLITIRKHNTPWGGIWEVIQ